MIRQRTAGVACLLFLLVFHARAQSDSWARQAGGTEIDMAVCTAMDDSGNSYVVGNFLSDSMDFGAAVLVNTNPGSTDIFLAKYDPDGILIWAIGGGAEGFDEAKSIAVDRFGNSYTVGVFTSAVIIFGDDTLTNAAAGFFDFFIVKRDQGGNVLWAKSGGGDGFDYALSVAVTDSGQCCLTGYFSSNTLSIGSDTLTNLGGYDLLLVKYDTDGAVLWARSAGGLDDEYARSVALSGAGECVLTGSFKSTTIAFGTHVLSTLGGSDIFVVKYDGEGDVLWAARAGGGLSDIARAVAVDDSGRSFITGSYNSYGIDFGTGPLPHSGNYDLFIAKYDTDGMALWAEMAGGSGSDEAYSIAVDGAGNSYVAGSFNSPTISFGSGTLASAGGDDLFIVKYDRDGFVLWSTGAGGMGSETAFGISADQSGNYCVAGSYSSDTIRLGPDTLTRDGVEDIFIVKYTSGGTVNRQFTVQDYWNMVSIPLTMEDYAKTELFPTAISNAFAFENGYIFNQTLENGRGYWVKFSAVEAVAHTGLERTQDTIDVVAGWNLIGSLSSSIPVSNIGSIPGGIVTSGFYAFDEGYRISATLDPGRGYWVKSSQAGKLVMSGTQAADPTMAIKMTLLK